MFPAFIPVFPYPNQFFPLSEMTLKKMATKRRKMKQTFNEKMGIKRTAVTIAISLEARLG